METKEIKTSISAPIKNAKKETTKKISKTWLAALANKGTGEILDMRAVLK